MFIVILSIFLLSACTLSSCTPRLYQLTQPFDHAECPTWDSRRSVLYFVDIHQGNVHAYDFYSKEIYSVHLPGDVSVVVPSRSDPNLLIVAVNRSLVALDWDYSTEKKLYRGKILNTVSGQFPTSRFNDGKADVNGRLWIGTMGFEDANGVVPNQGILYQITEKTLKNPSVIIAPVNISNGLTWNQDNTKFFYIDTPTRKIVVYDFDKDRGRIKNAKILADFDKFNTVVGFPDGMTIDRDDNLWVALYGGGCIVQIDSRTGQFLQLVAIPAEAVTSLMWGGPNLDILFVTTSRFRLTKEQRLRQPSAGSVFAVEGLGTSGRKVFNVDIETIFKEL